MLALAGASVQVVVGGVGWLASARHASRQPIPTPIVTPLLSDLMLLTLWSVGIVFVGVLCLGLLGHPLQP